MSLRRKDFSGAFSFGYQTDTISQEGLFVRCTDFPGMYPEQIF